MKDNLQARLIEAGKRTQGREDDYTVTYSLFPTGIQIHITYGMSYQSWAQQITFLELCSAYIDPLLYIEQMMVARLNEMRGIAQTA